MVLQTLAIMFRETGVEAAKLDVLTAEKLKKKKSPFRPDLFIKNNNKRASMSRNVSCYVQRCPGLTDAACPGV